MKKILLSLGMIVFVGVVVVGATGAFFSDTETSTGNTFTAGAIDLGIDNESYYNGVFNEGTSWGLSFDLDECQSLDQGPCLFFNFGDVKPGDYGEDTISIHVTNNEAWLCADVTLTKDDDVDCTEPENDVDAENGACTDVDDDDDGVGDNGDNDDGDLAQYIDFLWWADDGDNVLEEGEQTLQPAGNLGQLGVGNTATVALADSNGNIWGTDHPLVTEDGEILTPNEEDILYIGKAWCIGEITPDPVVRDIEINDGPDTPTNAGDENEVTPEDGGYNCDGSSAGNEAQTDSVMLDVSFRAEQARNNEGFVCTVPEQFPS
jgi:predicted ribosomally synthesized peptide with SipW-like signal peptide